MPDVNGTLDDKKRVLVYGSCRVFDAVLLLKRLGYIKSTELPGKWYTHSSKEVIQKKAILDLEMKLPPHLMPLLTADQTNAHLIADYITAKYKNAKKGWYTKPADIIVVEISSLKEFRGRRFYGQMGSHQILNKKQNREHLHKRTLKLFSGIRSSEQTPESLYADMERIVKLFPGKKMIFVSHINMPSDKGEPIPARLTIAETVKRFCAERGITYFDPTILAEKAGYENAMRNSTHYLMSFVPEIAQNLCRLFIDAPTKLLDGLAEHYRLRRAGQFAKAIKIGDQVLAEMPKQAARRELLLSMAICHEGLNQKPEALERYKDFIYKRA